MHQERLGADYLESSNAENLGILVDKFIVSLQCALAEENNLLDYVRNSITSRFKEVILFICTDGISCVSVFIIMKMIERQDTREKENLRELGLGQKSGTMCINT
ncbi:hypothetical protein BTVI_14804 [Pitangus sulphuratus]|nr:hypothetical protein BTVI_14804 [Pitangus sulphuratus]